MKFHYHIPLISFLPLARSSSSSPVSPFGAIVLPLVWGDALRYAKTTCTWFARTTPPQLPNSPSELVHVLRAPSPLSPAGAAPPAHSVYLHPSGRAAEALPPHPVFCISSQVPADTESGLSHALDPYTFAYPPSIMTKNSDPNDSDGGSRTRVGPGSCNRWIRHQATGSRVMQARQRKGQEGSKECITAGEVSNQGLGLNSR
ncbi:hypothetical protein C8R45DRAFT_932261 [Mycena sanguinolenta]|nr:hypothetical protein C8R45DRAFT_932261 [Mycena sanguinolenta]